MPCKRIDSIEWKCSKSEYQRCIETPARASQTLGQSQITASYEEAGGRGGEHTLSLKQRKNGG
ncbi:hypothetical protein N7499_008932 [Penicillium canescens]|uniref:Uncharacterized protein n=1 Tax=Penicillium canescens TaxID=5083 RepID=A0AAD6I0L0_PENCN|nr:uncharacterized protein N7446_013905 [Penicillium canescens]KAJ5984848.1 hypothetical protein N7522_012044 [Penicillium canescens]KAJ6023540.1 hypothetical protein N7460_013935 [Penicillium canescens]KAJ6025183.1 hypothetical protein N7444_012862 [Penicillium canescens]KAJ6042839.1 hypothetical protein N7446_013905 [Penicillium canescens]KAJ6076951.1 hypothetical protein N7499_008932 [Penicillium canescens]